MEGCWPGKGESCQHQKCMQQVIIGWGWAWYHELSMLRSELSTKPKAEADNTATRFLKSLYHVKINSIMFYYTFFLKICKRLFSLNLQKFENKTRTWCLETRQTLNWTWWPKYLFQILGYHVWIFIVSLMYNEVYCLFIFTQSAAKLVNKAMKTPEF